MKKPVILVAALVLLIAAGVMLRRSNRLPWFSGEGGAAPSPAVPPGIGVEVSGVNSLIVWHEGKKLWKLTANKISINSSQTVTTIQGLKEGVYYRDDKPLITYRADLLRLNTATKNIEINGHVQVTAYNGLLFTTDAVSWRAQQRALICPHVVTAALRQLLFRSHRLEFYPDRNRVICPNAVRITLGAALFTGARLTANLATEQVEIAGPLQMRARVGALKMPFKL